MPGSKVMSGIGATDACSADWQSAVSQVVNLRAVASKRVFRIKEIVGHSHPWPTASLRYGGIAMLWPAPYALAVNPNAINPALDRVKFQLRAEGAPAETANPLRTGIHTRGYLPHVKREGAAYFVTFRLADSLPQAVVLRFAQEQAEARRRLSPSAPGEQVEEIQRELRRKIERYLDQGVGECLLRRPEIAGLVAEALRHHHGQRYILDEWVVMPNHVHVILWPLPNFSLSEILRSRKRHMARQANLILGRTGENFWQRESYDHWIRNEAEKARIRRYIRCNPVKARLCVAPEEWQWGSAWSG